MITLTEEQVSQIRTSWRNNYTGTTAYKSFNEKFPGTMSISTFLKKAKALNLTKEGHRIRVGARRGTVQDKWNRGYSIKSRSVRNYALKSKFVRYNENGWVMTATGEYKPVKLVQFDHIVRVADGGKSMQRNIQILTTEDHYIKTMFENLDAKMDSNLEEASAIADEFIEMNMDLLQSMPYFQDELLEKLSNYSGFADIGNSYIRSKREYNEKIRAIA